jgi:hypothetical protein
VSPNDKVEIRWIGDFIGDGRVDVFDNPDGSGTPIDGLTTANKAIDHRIVLNVGGVIKADTTYYFKVTHSDPSGARADLTNGPAPFPSFFTGAQPPGAEPEQPKLTAPNGGAGWSFDGVSVAISGDTVVVGAPLADSIDDTLGFREGAAYVFVTPEGGWAPTTTFAARLTASDVAGFARFGTSVAIDGDTVVVVGSCAAYVFVKPADGWAGNLTETAKLTGGACFTTFGRSAVAIDGDIVVVGAESDDSFKGSAYVFMKPAGGWTGNVNETAKLTASDSEPGSGSHPGDGFGQSVAISGDTVVVGAHEDTHGSWPVLQGSAYVFLKPAGGWGDTSAFAAKLTASDGLGRDQFGFSVAISGDTLVVGAPGTGYPGSYVFVKPAGGWAGHLIESAKLTASDLAFLDFFGSSVAISGDSVLIGASGDEDAKGAAYVFLKPAEGWAGNLNEPVKLTASDGETFDFLGTSVAISGDTFVLGADEWGDFQASAYVFTGPTAPTDSTAPAITVTTPPQGAVYALNHVVNADYSCQDEAGGSGLASCVGTAANGAALDTATVGAKTFTVMAADHAGNTASLSHTYSVVYNFGGFLPPLDSLPTLNRMKAGAAAPVKFSLAGFRGLGIFAAGYPTSIPIACDSSALVDAVDQMLSAGSSGLSYDATTDVYTYVWKTEKSWAKSCRQLVVKLDDGTIHRANFTFE